MGAGKKECERGDEDEEFDNREERQIEKEVSFLRLKKKKKKKKDGVTPFRKKERERLEIHL